MSAITTIRLDGHLIDSDSLRRVMDQVIHAGATYAIEEFRVGRTNDDPSTAILRISATDEAALAELMGHLVPLGAVSLDLDPVELAPAPADGVAPAGFYSTTNHRTEIRLRDRWLPVARQRMDAVIVVDGERAVCTKLRDVVADQSIVVNTAGIRVTPPAVERDRAHFGFMSAEISSERHVEHIVRQLVADMRRARAAGRKVIAVAGPVVVHTGGVDPMCRLLAAGALDGILAGNALAVHDVERALYNTSLGIDADTGEPVVDGHRNHMMAINAIRRAGDIPRAVASGLLTTGIMHACVSHGVPYVLAGSLRDDGPLPETITDMNDAQDAYGRMLEGAGVVLILSSMLHGIATGNMLPSNVMTVCVDINPAVVTKLADRGSAQTVGVVTDVGLFTSLLAQRYGEGDAPAVG